MPNLLKNSVAEVSQLRLPPDLTERTLRDRVKELKESMVRFMDEHGPLPPGTVTMYTLQLFGLPRPLIELT